MAVGREERLGRRAQGVELAALLGHVGQDAAHGGADGLLPVGDHAADRHRQRVSDRAQQRHQVVLAAAEQAARQQHRARQAVAQHPEHVVPHVRRPAVEGQDDLFLLRQALPQRRVVGQAQRHHLRVAPQLLGDAALGDGHAASDERPADLRDAAVLGVAQRPDQGDDIQAEFPVRQRPAAFLLGAVGAAGPRAGGTLAMAHDQVQPIQPVERGDGAAAVVGDVGGTATGDATTLIRLEGVLVRCGGAGVAAGHRAPPWLRANSTRAQSSSAQRSLPA